jgi:hypothetical protein
MTGILQDSAAESIIWVGVLAIVAAVGTYLFSKFNGPIQSQGAAADVRNDRRRSKKNVYCSFCRKNYLDVGPLVEGPGNVFICGDCIGLCQSILDQERKRRGTTRDGDVRQSSNPA